MKRLTRIALIGLILVSFPVLMLSEGKGEVDVECNLSGHVQRVWQKEVVLTFSHDMIALGEKRDGGLVATITPEIKGTFHWRGTRTLAFKPKRRFAYSTRYRVSINKNIHAYDRQKIVKQKHFEFTTSLAYPATIHSKESRPKYWTKHLYSSSHRISSGQTIGAVHHSNMLIIDFKQPMKAGELGKYLSIENNKNNRPITFKIFRESNEKTGIMFVKPLPRAQTIRITLKKGLKGKEGNTGTRRDFVFYIQTLPVFAYNGPDRFDITTDRAEISLPFTVNLSPRFSPLNMRVVRRGARGEEPYTGFSIQTPPTFITNKINLLFVDSLAAGDRLTVYLDKETANVYGEELPAPVKLEINVCSSMPVLDVETGLNGAGLRLREITRADVHLYRLKNSFIDALKENPKDLPPLFSPKFDSRFVAAKKKETVKPSLMGSGYFSYPYRQFPTAPGSENAGNPGNTTHNSFFAATVSGADWNNNCNDYKINRFQDQVPTGLRVIHRRNADMMLRVYKNKTLVWVYRTPKDGLRFTGPVPGAAVTVYRKNTGIKAGKTGKDGILVWPHKLEVGDFLTATVPGTNETAFYRVDSNDVIKDEPGKKSAMVSVFTDRHLYRPGDTVHIAGVIKLRDRSGTLSPVNPKKYRVKVWKDQDDDNELLDTALNADSMGAFYHKLNTPENARSGYYVIEVQDEDENEHGYTYIQLSYYMADTFKVKITGVPGLSAPGGDTPGPVVTAVFLSGSPMANARMRLYFNAEPGLSGDYLSENELNECNFGLAREFGAKSHEIRDKEIKLDSRGRYAVPIAPYLKVNYPVDFGMSAVAETEEGMESGDRAWGRFIPGHRVTGIDVPDSAEAGKDAVIRLVVRDHRLKPASAAVDFFIMRVLTDDWYMEQKGARHLKTIDTRRDVKIHKTGTLTFKPAEPGVYIIKAETRDPEGRVVMTSAQFKAAGPNRKRREWFDISTSSDIYAVGDSIRLNFRSPHKGKTLITIERDGLIDWIVTDIHRTGRVDIPVKSSYFPKISIKADTIMENGKWGENQIHLLVTGKEKQLNVNIKPCSDEILPGRDAFVDIRVTGSGGKGKKARVFVYAVNEGTLQLSNYEPPDPYVDLYMRQDGDMSTDEKTLLSKIQRSFILTAQPPYLRFTGPSLPLRGRVRSAGGKPVTGARVTLHHDTIETFHREDQGVRKKKAGKDPEASRWVYTDSRGDYDFGLLSRAFPSISFEKPGFKSYHRSLNWTREDGRLDAVLEELPPPGPKKTGAKGKKNTDTLAEDENGVIIRGVIYDPEGVTLPGIYVELADAATPGLRKTMTVSGELGEFHFTRIPAGKYRLRAYLEGLKTDSRILDVKDKDISVDITMELQVLQETITVTSKAAPSTILKYWRAYSAPGVDDDLASILRKDFREVLFFRSVQTGPNGRVRIPFKTAHTLSTYRIMAVALTGDSYGTAAVPVTVSKKLLIEEAVPEFARLGDRFIAGCRTANRESRPMTVDLRLQPLNRLLEIKDNIKQSIHIPANRDKWLWFHFKALRAGTEELRFFARESLPPGDTRKKPHADALVKILPVTPCLVEETIIDFDMGTAMKKKVVPVPGTIDPQLEAKVSPTLLEPARFIREKLENYPYRCLEQRTSRIMPFVLLDKEFLDLSTPGKAEPLTIKQIKTRLNAYIDQVPLFLHKSGGLSYYKGSGWASDYLTVYVLWALKQARLKFPDLETKLEERLDDYLSERKLTGNLLVFYRFVSSLDDDGPGDGIGKLYQKRADLSVMGRVFLYRALDNLGKRGGIGNDYRKWLKQMLAEFNNSLRVEADFAYFSAGDFSYDREYPFYSSRFVTALLLQGILEVEGGHTHAPKIINWLLEVPRVQWFTTQTNVWILYAANEYGKKVETGNAVRIRLQIPGKTLNKTTSRTRGAVSLGTFLKDPSVPAQVTVDANHPVYLTTQLTYQLKNPPAENKGIKVERRVYDEEGKRVDGPGAVFEKGKRYFVEVLMDVDKEVPYAVVDEPLAAGFEVVRPDLATTRELKPVKTGNEKDYNHSWARPEYTADRVVFYTYYLNGKVRVVYFIKAMYTGTFTWMPTQVRGMYHPQFFGRAGVQTAEVKSFEP